MWRTLLFASLAFGPACWQVDGVPLQVMSAPNVLHVGSAENIFVECQDCTGADMTVTIMVKNHLTKTNVLAATAVTLSSTNHYQAFGQITVSPEHFSSDPGMNQYVYLQAQFPDRLLEQVVLVSFHFGHIFIQTDKPLYTPNSRVLFRLFAITPKLEPVKSDDYAVADAVDIEIVTPDNVILLHEQVRLDNSGKYTGQYMLPETASHGLWRLVAKFHRIPQQSFFTEFEVKEYVLPNFKVTLTPERPFLYVDSQSFTINIKASYLFNEEVDGMAYVLFGALVHNQKHSFLSSLQSVPIKRGAGEAVLKRDHIMEHLPNIDVLTGSSLLVTVSVLTEDGSEMAEAELKNIPIVTSPYTITLKKTPRYYKPGVPLYISAEVMNPDGSPAQGVPVVINPGHVQGNTLADGRVRLAINPEVGSSSLVITARTNNPGISAERQASVTMQAVPYSSRSNSWIHISVSFEEVEVGYFLRTTIVLNMQGHSQRDVSYLVLSRGQLVKFGRYPTSSNKMIPLAIRITKEMQPSFRIIAYYHTDDNEMVSDSVWVNVKDSCMGKLQLELSRPDTRYEPRMEMGLKVTGDPGARVELLAVDKGVHALNNNRRLTQKKVWDIVEKRDISCTPGGGRDAMGVFYDAGLLFQTNALGTPVRQEIKCSGPTRSKRASPSTGATTDLSDDDDDDSFPDSNEILSRTKFPESWLWTNFHLPACPIENLGCDSTSHLQMVQLPDTITTWLIRGISLSQTHGVCVSEPLEVKVQKDFFIDLKVPYSAVQGEQIEIKAVIHNYIPTSIKVRVELMEEQHLCSDATRSKHGKYRQRVEVGPFSQQSVPFIISPMKEGLYNVEVKAAVQDSFLKDGIIKTLRVMPRGILTKYTIRRSLDPTNRGGTQEEILNSAIPKSRLFPNSPVSTTVSVTAFQPQMNALKEIEKLFLQPVGNGEGIMIHMTPPVIATVYLDKTDQWKTVGLQKRDVALHQIKHGYERELAYRKKDGSFAVWNNYHSSSWLTAYVVKVFAMVSDVMPVQSDVICDAVKFLITFTQQPDGSFQKHGPTFYQEMTGDVYGRDTDASMTAFCLIAMQESRALCSGHVHTLQASIQKAVSYLEQRLPQLTNAYAVAMASYALSMENKLNREVLFRFASPDRSHWPVARGQIYTLEATAYALLALVKTKASEDARPVAKWLNQQPKDDRGYGSTQATMMVYQALAEHWVSVTGRGYFLAMSVLMPGRSRPYMLRFNKENYLYTKTFKTNVINQDVRVTVEGTGNATVTMLSMYYARPEELRSDCQKFDLSVQLLPDKTDNMTYWLHINVMFKNPLHDATMSALDIGLPTGFIINAEDLSALSQEDGRTISRHGMNLLPSNRGSEVLLFLDKVSHTQPEEIRFRIQQKFKVGVLQPAAVSVNEYFDSAEKCVKFYHPHGDTVQLLCTNDTCTCDKGTCSKQKVRVSKNERDAKICESTQTYRTDFAYKVQLENITEGPLLNHYTMRIPRIIKDGRTDAVLPGELRTFLASKHCGQSLDLRPGKSYLIMGQDEDINRNAESQQYNYVLNERTWIEYWPTDQECQTDVYTPNCFDIQEFVDVYLLFGCAI